jgi:hypothetical protein
LIEGFALHVGRRGLSVIGYWSQSSTLTFLVDGQRVPLPAATLVQPPSLAP